MAGSDGSHWEGDRPASGSRGGGRNRSRGRRSGDRGRGRGGRDRRGQSQAEWFVHDSRNDDFGDHNDRETRSMQVDVSPEGQRVVSVRPPKPEDLSSASLVVQIGPGDQRTVFSGKQQATWLYIDPHGDQQGPFPSARILQWEKKGYFDGQLKVAKSGSKIWQTLDSVRPLMTEETSGALTHAPGAETGTDNTRGKELVDTAGEAEATLVMRRSEGGTGPRKQDRVPVRERLQPVGDPSAQKPQQQQQPQEQVQKNGQPSSKPKQPLRHPWADRNRDPTDGGRRPHPAEQLLGGGRGQARGSGSRREDTGSRAGRGGGRGSDPKPQRGGRGGGRGGGGAGRGQGKNQIAQVSSSLFISGATMGSEEPMWRYLDIQGGIQGPFTAGEMQAWFVKQFLQPDLLVCGTERRVSPPNLPDKSFYRPLGDLLAEMQRGQKYKPVSPEDIRAKKEANAGAA